MTPKERAAEDEEDEQWRFAVNYNKENRTDLHYRLTTYVDLKCPEIWAGDTLKAKKWEIKENCTYFRIVKQGSVAVYLTFHIFTIFVILISATMR